jgi:Holliday junction resolvasome RuvABC endonuclease subunit
VAKRKHPPTKVLGIDASLNHGAAVELTDGVLSNFWYCTDIAGAAAKSKKRGFRLEVPTPTKVRDPQVRAMYRLAWLEHFWDKNVLMKSLPFAVGLEDYALSEAQGSHQIGEIGGTIRLLCWFRGLRLRLHDPVTLKMYTAHDGTADKSMMEAAVQDRWGVDFSIFNPPAPKPTAKNKAPKQNRTVSEDLHDAYALAQLTWLEVQLRRGEVLLKDLHEKEIRVFNRVTKAHPVSLLDREWILNPDGTPTPHGEPVCATCGSRKCCLAKKAKAA